MSELEDLTASVVPAQYLMEAPPFTASGDIWLAIETAPKNAHIQLWRAGAFDCGRFDDDRYAAKPRPFWQSELRKYLGKAWARKNPPTHWKPYPNGPVSP